MRNSRRVQWDFNRYHVLAIVLALLALLLSIILSLYRFVTVDSHFDLTVHVTISRLLSPDDSHMDFRYVLDKEEVVVFDISDTVDLFALAVPVVGDSSHRVTFMKKFFMPDGSGFGTYTLHVYANHLGEERPVTSFDLFVFPRFVSFFFSYFFLILLLLLALVFVFIGMQKRQGTLWTRKHVSQFFSLRNKKK